MIMRTRSCGKTLIFGLFGAGMRRRARDGTAASLS